MAFPRPIDETLHGITDYQVGTVLMTVFPRLVGVSGTRSAKQIRTSGAIHAGYSTLTNYTLGVVKVIPYKAHLALDLLGAVGIAATPFVTGQYKEGRRQWLPHVGLALFELTSLVFTDPTGKGDYKADPARASEKNMMSPRDGIDGPRAVTHNGGGPSPVSAA